MKTIPKNRATHTHIAYIWNYPSPGSNRDRGDHFKEVMQKKPANIIQTNLRSVLSHLSCICGPSRAYKINLSNKSGSAIALSILATWRSMSKC